MRSIRKLGGYAAALEKYWSFDKRIYSVKQLGRELREYQVQNNLIDDREHCDCKGCQRSRRPGQGYRPCSRIKSNVAGAPPKRP